MKTILLLLLSFNTFAQQLILNGSFEQGLTPNQSGQIYKADDWVTAGESPDLYSSNATSFSCVSIPYNFLGTVTAQEGTSVAGIACYVKGWDNFREYITQHLDTPLIKNHHYELSLYVKTDFVQNYYGCIAASNFGILFSKQKPHPDNLGVINRQPQCEYVQPMWYSTWTQLHFNFVADSNYKYITIGNFTFDSLQVRTQICSALLFDVAYVLIDNVSLKESVTSGIEELQGVKKKRVLLYRELLGQKIK